MPPLEVAPTAFFTFDLDLQPQVSYGHDPHAQNVKVKGHFLQKIERKQTDIRTKPIALPSSLNLRSVTI